MAKFMKKPPAVPKVKLLDPHCEPSDDELSALMEEVRRTAVRKRDATWRQFADELARAVNKAAGAPDARSRPRTLPPPIA